MTKEAIYNIVREVLMKYKVEPIEQITKEITDKIDIELYFDELADAEHQ